VVKTEVAKTPVEAAKLSHKVHFHIPLPNFRGSPRFCLQFAATMPQEFQFRDVNRCHTLVEPRSSRGG
jgi:hypothetical protein